MCIDQMANKGTTIVLTIRQKDTSQKNIGLGKRRKL